MQGLSSNDYARVAAFHMGGGVTAYSATGTALSVASGRLSYTLRLMGPAVTVETGEGARAASSLPAQQLLCRSCLVPRTLCHSRAPSRAHSLLLLAGLAPHGLQCHPGGAGQPGAEQRRQPDAHARHAGHVSGEGGAFLLPLGANRQGNCNGHCV